MKERRRRAIRARFEGPGGRGSRELCYSVFTVPPELRAAAADPKTWRKWRRALWRCIKKKFGGRFAVERTDPAGKCGASERSGEPCDCRKCTKWHPHLNLLWVQVEGARPFIDVELLAGLWGAIIGSARRVDVDHHYARDAEPAQREHWYKYLGRTWPDWVGVVKSHLTVRWLGGKAVPKKPPKESGCPVCGSDFIFISDLEESEAERLLLLSAEEFRAEWERRRAERRARIGESIGPGLPMPRGRNASPDGPEILPARTYGAYVDWLHSW